MVVISQCYIYQSITLYNLHICIFYSPIRGFLGDRVKNLLTTQEIQVQSLGWEDTLEKGMAIHSSIHAWRIPWTDSPLVCKESGTSITEMKTEINKGNLIKPKSFCTAQETKQGEKTTFRMGENNSK